MRSKITRMSCALAALALLFTSSANASADPAPRELVENATVSIARTTALASTELAQVTRSAVQTINHLAAEGAPPRVLHETAQRHITAINTLAAAGKAHSDRIAAVAILVLDHIGAPDPFKRTVAVANTSSNAAITLAAARARHAVARALQSVLPEQDESTDVLAPKSTDAIDALAA